MKEKELRLALVCYGGVSLVLYMQGVTKEVLKLVRASKAYHSITERSERSTTSFAAIDGDRGRECDTETVYFSLLQSLAKSLDLRVVVDSVAGASAGGISGIVLSRALAHDLSVDHLRSEWLKETDVVQLLAKTHRASTWSKWFLYPVLWIGLRSPLFGLKTNAQIRRKLSTFFRSKWFEAPFGGDRFLELLFDGLHDMHSTENDTASLMPPGHVLDLAVAVTDFFGFPHRMTINTPHTVQEREHASLWKFRYCRWNDRQIESDLNDDGVAGLALAARATSSLPGAFPPTQIGDMDELLTSRGLGWPSRSKFIATNFKEHLRSGIDPTKTSFVDGGIVNDKPLSAAIDAVRQRASYRDVDRRLVYIDPDPQPNTVPPDGKPPSYLQTLEATTFDIPLRAPIHKELEQLEAFNKSIGHMQQVLAAARPEIEQLVCEIIGSVSHDQYTSEKICGWRQEANALAVERAGYAYHVYARSKSISVLEQIIALASKISELAPGSSAQMALADQLRAAADRQEITAPNGSLHARQQRLDPPAWVAFLLRFDHAFRYRRLSFVAQAINELDIGAADFARVAPEILSSAKSRMQDCMSQLRAIHTGAFVSSKLQADLDGIVSKARITAGNEHGQALHAEKIDALMERLGDEIDLATTDSTTDAIIASLLSDPLPEIARRAILVSYLGFSFWDVWTFPISAWHEFEEHREVRVDRISPADPSVLGNGEAASRLKGSQLRDFAGFLSRPIRENDYLWGRLNGTERLIDIVCDAVLVADVQAGIDVKAIKKSAFLSILEAESRWLEDKKLLAGVRKLIDEM